MRAKQPEYAYSKCKNLGIIVIEQVYEYESQDKNSSQLNPFECAMLNYFELYNVHAKRAATEGALCSIQR